MTNERWSGRIELEVAGVEETDVIVAAERGGGGGAVAGVEAVEKEVAVEGKSRGEEKGVLERRWGEREPDS